MTDDYSERTLAAEVARRYYVEDERKVEIAAAMGLSRFKVARLIETAKATGIVRIEIVDVDGVDATRSAALRDALGLRRCLVATATADSSLVRERIATAGAQLLREEVTAQPDALLGLPWSRMVSAVVARLGDLPPITVVQLSGSLVISGESSPVAMVRFAAGRGGEPLVFYAPLVLADAASASAMRQHPDVATALARVDDVTVAAVGVGAWSSGQSTIFDAVSSADQRSVAAAGVVGETLGVFFDAAGKVVKHPLSERLVSISAAELRAIPHVVGIAQGAEKAEAVLAAVRGGMVSSLVVDQGLAVAITALL